MFESGDQFQAARSDDEGFGHVVDEDDHPSAEQGEQRGEEEGGPHAVAFAFWMEILRGELAGTAGTATHAGEER